MDNDPRPATQHEIAAAKYLTTNNPDIRIPDETTVITTPEGGLYLIALVGLCYLPSDVSNEDQQEIDFESLGHPDDNDETE